MASRSRSRSRGRRRKSSTRKRSSSRSQFRDVEPFPGGSLQILQEAQQEEFEQRWEGMGLSKRIQKELNTKKKRQFNRLEKRYWKELKELKAEQRQDVLETAGLLNPISYPDGKISEEEMAQCSLKDYKLSEVVLQRPLPEVKDLTVDVMVNDFLMPAFTLMNKETEETVSLFCEDVDPRPELTAVLQGLVKYAENVPPELSVDLFEGSISKESGGKMRGWSYLLRLCEGDEIPFFQKIKASGGKGKKDQWEFIKRMRQIVGESEDVKIIGLKTCLIGYTYGFWLAKLYNKRGIEDERLPAPLSNAKQHFMEYPWDPEGASDGFHYDNFPVTL